MEPTTVQSVTFHVPGMVERQNITWLTWRNRVSEALVGLPGVGKVTPDLDKDLLQVHYRPGEVTVEQMLEAIRGQGFEGTIVEGAAAAR